MSADVTDPNVEPILVKHEAHHAGNNDVEERCRSKAKINYPLIHLNISEVRVECFMIIRHTCKSPPNLGRIFTCCLQ